MKVIDHKEYLNEDKSLKGYGIVFKTNFGDRINSYVNADEADDYLSLYSLESVHIVDVYAYKGFDGAARLGIKLERDLHEEIF